MLRQNWKQLLAAASLLEAAAGSAHAQMTSSLDLLQPPEATVAERQSVLQRPRADYDPLGIQAGSFLLFPYLNVAETYNSNVYATTSNEKSDFVTYIRPSVELQSNWNTDALTFQANGDIREYASQSSEDNSNFSAFLNGRKDVERGLYLIGSASYQLLHEDRTDPNAITNAKEPIEYELATGGIGFVHETGRIGFRIEGTINDYSYQNGVFASGAPVIETDRNRIEYTGTVRVSYELVPGYNAFVQGSGNDRSYQDKFDQGGYQRSSSGYVVDVGTAFALGPTLNGEVYVGYLNQSYDDSRLSSPSVPTFGASLLWNVTQLTSIRGTVARTVEETIIAPASSYLQTQVSLGVEHELLRNVLLSGKFTYALQDYQGGGRSDDYYEADAQVRYMLTRNLSTGLDINYSTRSSNSVGVAEGANYDRTLVAANIRLQF